MNKKDIVQLFSFLAITISTILFILLSSGTFKQADQILKPNSAWAYFPLNQAQTIDFDIEQNSFNQLTDREKEEQLRDWLLLTIASDKNFTANDINNSLYSLSPIRYGYLKPVSNFEYGDSRSFSMGNGKIVALLPKGISQQERLNNLASIADKYRKNLGKKPTTIEVFEYDIQPEQKQALLTRTEELDAGKFFTKESGYSESVVTTLNALETFLKQIDDLTFAQVNGSILTLGGRKIAGYPSGGIKLEDIATIWQSEKKIREQPDKFKVNGSGFSLDPSYDYKGLQAELEKVRPLLQSLKLNNNTNFQNVGLRRTQSPQGKTSTSPIYDDSIRKAQEGLSKENINPYEDLVNKLKQDINNKLVSPPFLDLDFEKTLKQINSQYEKELEKELQKILKQKIPKQELEKLKHDLEAKEKAKIERLIDEKIKKRINTIDRFLTTPSSYGFQSARYDGDLQGTEVGMVLFYTDLLAKIWGFDYTNSTPEEYIQGFKPKTKIAVSSIYKRELQDNTHTRTWFEPNVQGFQLANQGNDIIFSRNATKVSARSFSLSKAGEEIASTAITDLFLRWWNDHYEEVARYEPQYERLNQIMKISLLISWLNESGNGNLLYFLKDVKVKHNYWFPNWVQVNKNKLKFNYWATKPCQGTWESDPDKSKKPVCFYRKGYKGQKTETMPLLTSATFKQFGKDGIYFTGGVSLADQGLFQDRKPLPESPEISEASLRSEIDYSSIKSDGKKITFKTVDETIHSLNGSRPSEAYSITKAKEGTRFRSPNVELNNLPISRKTTRTNEGIEINTAVNNVEINNVNITRVENGFSIGLRSRDIDLGQALVADLNNSPKNPEDFLISHPQVLSLAQNGDVYYVKLENSENWLELKLGLRLDSAGGGGGKVPPKTPFFYMEHEKGPIKYGQDKGNGGNGDGELASNADTPSDDDKVWVLAFLKQEEIDKRFNEGSVKCTKEPCHTKGTQDNSAYQNFSHELNIGNDVTLAQKLADNPQQFYKNQKQYLNDKIKEINSDVVKNKFDLALAKINELIEWYGKTPTLMTKKALILVAKEKINFQRMLIGTKPNTTSSNKNFLDEIKLLITNSTKFKGIVMDNTLIYVEDSPGLNNLDWSQPITTTAFFTSGKPRVYRLQNGGNGNGGGLGTMGFGDDDFNEEIKSLASSADYEEQSGSDPFAGQRFYPIHSSSDNSDCLTADTNDNQTSKDVCVNQSSLTQDSDGQPKIYIVFDKPVEDI